MKLATYRDGSRDGQLVVVSRDLSLAHYASGIATRLQQVLDDWNFLSPQLEDLSATLNGGKARHAFAFDPARCHAPLPRAYQWALAPAQAEAAPVQRASDELLGPLEEAVLPAESAAVGLQAGWAVVTGDVPQGATPAQALERVRLVLLAHVWSVSGGISPPAGAFAPVAVTPEELGGAWRDARVHLAVDTIVEGAGQPTSVDFSQLLATLAKVRAVRAGSIIGPFASPPQAATGPASADAPAGPEAGWWRSVPVARSEATGQDGLSVCGAIAQRIVRASEGAPRA